jgi:hypothetical protein
MTTKALLTTALEGGTPEITPISFYSWMFEDLHADAVRRVIDQGLGICRHCFPLRSIEHGVKNLYEEKVEGTNHYAITTKQTPIGAIRQVSLNGWHHEFFIKEPADYKIMQWIVEHTELQPLYEEFAKDEEMVGDNGIVLLTGSRTPAMSINVDWAGTEQFCLDVALEVPELYDLYAARKQYFLEETRLLAAAPGRFVKWFENLTISMLGPTRYAQLLMPIYDEAVPLLAASGKRVMVHYDGALGVIADQIARAPFHMVESLTEAPEGDLNYDECRAAWPEKVLWANLNVDCYFRTPDALRAAVIAKRTRAGKRGFAFEISEDLPSNWQESVPIVLETLRELQ